MKDFFDGQHRVRFGRAGMELSTAAFAGGEVATQAGPLTAPRIHLLRRSNQRVEVAILFFDFRMSLWLGRMISPILASRVVGA
jgi:hypothetical protein